MATKASIFLVSLFLLIALSEQIDYEFLQVLYQWQPAVCNGKYCKEPISNRFSIHGVWPSNPSGKIGPCSGSEYDPDKIKALKPRMIENWPDLVNGKPEEEWAKKWSNHGTCSESYLNQRQYFASALAIYDEYGVGSYLEKAKIIPDGRTYYRMSEILGAISLYTNKKAAVRCSVDWRGRKQMEMVTMCFSKRGNHMIDCEDKLNYTCPEEFVWNPMPLY